MNGHVVTKGASMVWNHWFRGRSPRWLAAMLLGTALLVLQGCAHQPPPDDGHAAVGTENPDARKEYYRQNRERLLAKARAYREAHREEINAAARARYAAQKK